MDGVRSGSFTVADCAVAGVVLRGYATRDLGYCNVVRVCYRKRFHEVVCF